MRACSRFQPSKAAIYKQTWCSRRNASRSYLEDEYNNKLAEPSVERPPPHRRAISCRCTGSQMPLLCSMSSTMSSPLSVPNGRILSEILPSRSFVTLYHFYCGFFVKENKGSNCVPSLSIEKWRIACSTVRSAPCSGPLCRRSRAPQGTSVCTPRTPAPFHVQQTTSDHNRNPPRRQPTLSNNALVTSDQLIE